MVWSCRFCSKPDQGRASETKDGSDSKNVIDARDEAVAPCRLELLPKGFRQHTVARRNRFLHSVAPALSEDANLVDRQVQRLQPVEVDRAGATQEYGDEHHDDEGTPELDGSTVHGCRATSALLGKDAQNDVGDRAHDRNVTCPDQAE